jgi:hypothetical protein
VEDESRLARAFAALGRGGQQQQGSGSAADGAAAAAPASATVLAAAVEAAALAAAAARPRGGARRGGREAALLGPAPAPALTEGLRRALRPRSGGHQQQQPPPLDAVLELVVRGVPTTSKGAAADALRGVGRMHSAVAAQVQQQQKHQEQAGKRARRSEQEEEQQEELKGRGERERERSSGGGALAPTADVPADAVGTLRGDKLDGFLPPGARGQPAARKYRTVLVAHVQARKQPPLDKGGGGGKK